nr:MAG TPA: hypothetical protein [Caudoviricetes sp.]
MLSQEVEKRRIIVFSQQMRKDFASCCESIRHYWRNHTHKCARFPQQVGEDVPTCPTVGRPRYSVERKAPPVTILVT